MRDAKVGERGAVTKTSKPEMSDSHFRRIPGWIVEKRWEVCWIEETVRGVLRVEGRPGWWPRLWEGLLRR